MLHIDTDESAQEFLQYLQEGPKILGVFKNVINTSEYGEIEIDNGFTYLLEIAKDCELKEKEAIVTLPEAISENPIKTDYTNHFIYGKNEIEKVVCVEVINSETEAICKLFLNDGNTIDFTYQYWLLAPIAYDQDFVKLEGNLHYKYIKYFNTKKEFSDHIFEKRKYRDYFIIWDDSEQIMVLHGITLFKGLKPEDVSVLSFDIEASGLVRDETSKVFMISNTFKDGKGNFIRKTFTVDKYNNDSTLMIAAWNDWVQEIDPAIIIAHNGYGYDLDYMNHVVQLDLEKLYLGKDYYPVEFSKNSSKFRVDGSNEWEYKKAKIFGRQFVDTMFLSVRYDIGRSFPSWKLKEIVDFKVKELEAIKTKEKKKFSKKNQELLDRWSHGGERVFYDASKIKEDWKDEEKRKLIIKYGEADSDDALNLYELMIPSFFYFSQSVPKSFTTMCTSASGSQLNSFLVRSYLQDGHSIPKATEIHSFGGGISFGIPGMYKNVVRFDVQSLYPSIIRELQIYDKDKDPKAHFLKMVEFFTLERFKNKKLAKQTGDRYYDDLQGAQKIAINSSFGLMGASGLNFNSIENAALITTTGRDLLKKTILWLSGKTFEHWYEKVK